MSIQDAMLPMSQATDADTEIGLRWSGQRVVGKQAERIVEAVHIDFGYGVTKPLQTVSVDSFKIALGGDCKAYLSHAVPVAWQ